MPPTPEQIEVLANAIDARFTCASPPIRELDAAALVAWDYVVEECARALQARAFGMLPTKSQEAQIAADALADAIDVLRGMKTNATE